jgi:hypothetical protein
MSEFSDLEFNQMMQQHFGSLKKDKEEQQFFLYYDSFGKILSMSANQQEEFKDDLVTNITREEFLKMQDVNLNNYIIDKDSDPVKIVDISSNASRNNSMLHKLDPSLWNPERLVTLLFNKETRNLKINVASSLPSKRKLWVVPKGNYLLSLAEIDLQHKQELEYHIKEYKKINSCEILTEDDVNVFMAYKEIENETDLSN